MKSRFYLSAALAVAMTAVVAGPASASVIAPPAGPPSKAVIAATNKVGDAVTIKEATDRQVLAARKALASAHAAVLSAPKSSAAAKRAAKVYATAAKRYTVARAAQIAAAKQVNTLNTRLKAVTAGAKAAYWASRPAITAGNIDRLGNRLAYKNYSVNPTYFLVKGLKKERPVGGIRLTTGYYSSAAVGIWYGSCSLTYATPAPVASNTHARNVKASYKSLVRFGFSPQAAAALVAVANDRSGMVPTQKSAGFGLLGWSNAAALRATAAKASTSANSLSFQLSYLIHQVRASAGLSATSRSTSTSGAVAGFSRAFGSAYKVAVANRAAAILKKYRNTTKLSLDPGCTNRGMSLYAAKYISLIGVSKLRGWFDNKKYYVSGMCQKNSQSVWKMVGGKNVNDGIYGNAIDVGMYMRNHGKLHAWSGYAPRGALVWWDNAIGGGYGHVAVSDGVGHFINNWSTGRISSTSFSSLGVTPMGWADPAVTYGPLK